MQSESECPSDLAMVSRGRLSVACGRCVAGWGGSVELWSVVFIARVAASPVGGFRGRASASPRSVGVFMSWVLSVSMSCGDCHVIGVCVCDVACGERSGLSVVSCVALQRAVPCAFSHALGRPSLICGLYGAVCRAVCAAVV